ncbi:unannotated protein [freshwater metagenome]|uniref:Unannotated protein n=1 Tax=freshwater metagenome TaxID=449393 RepID=A0A6J6L7U0_9ZZZZ
MASEYPHPVSEEINASNAANLANHPPSGGIPANDAMKIVMRTATPGAYENNPP